jgi:cyclopropane fatty-acyl-phospholipid synthase-like methyltransferase
MQDFWNNRYNQKDYAYGKQANQFFTKQIQNLQPGKALFPAEGEGRNAVYAAQLGWKVDAFDISIEGKNKAENLAKERKVSINYTVGDLENLHFKTNQFDLIVLIFAHFETSKISLYHNILASYLRKDGLLILEGFSKNHLNYNSKNPNVGGPKDIDMLFSVDEIQNDFKDLHCLTCSENEIELNEGIYHVGKGSVIRYIGKKIS